MRRTVLLLLLGTLIGIGIGLTFGWLVAPVQPVGSPMSDLTRRYKDEYTIMVAKGFLVDGDFQAAIDRLRLLRVDNVLTYVRDVTERFITQQGTSRPMDTQALVSLSCALGYCTEPMQPFLLATPSAGS
ncbi:MAG: hypothetical protein OHK0023_25200 [Anaerolineae bacterium]